MKVQRKKEKERDRKKRNLKENLSHERKSAVPEWEFYRKRKSLRTRESPGELENEMERKPRERAGNARAETIESNLSMSILFHPVCLLYTYVYIYHITLFAERENYVLKTIYIYLIFVHMFTIIYLLLFYECLYIYILYIYIICLWTIYVFVWFILYILYPYYIYLFVHIKPESICPIIMSICSSFLEPYFVWENLYYYYRFVVLRKSLYELYEKTYMKKRKLYVLMQRVPLYIKTRKREREMRKWN